MTWQAKSPRPAIAFRGLLTQIHPALERVLGPRLDHPAVLDLLERYPSPTQLAAVSEKQLANRLVKLAPRMGKGLAAEIVQALSEQSVVVLGTQAASIVLPRMAQQLAAREVLHWLSEVANVRIHATTGERPSVRLPADQARLGALPVESLQHPLSVYDSLLEVAA